MSDEITREEKIAFLKHLFPEPTYSVEWLAGFFKKHKNTIRYQIEIHEVPTIKPFGSPLVLQEELIQWMLEKDEKEKCDYRNIGIAAVLERRKKLSKRHNP